MIYIIFGALCFCSGFLLGNYYSFPTSEIGNSAAEVLSALGTIGAVFVGALALNTWKNQFEYQEKYKNIVALEAAFKNAISLFDHYRYKYLECARNGVPHEKRFELAEFKSYQEASFKYQQEWSIATFLLDKKTEDAFEFKPSQLHSLLLTFLNPINERYEIEPMDKQSSENKVLSFEDDVDKLFRNGVASIRDLIRPRSFWKCH